MNKLTMVILALALAGCGRQLKETDIAVPSWACAQKPTGKSRVVMDSEYCGRACSRQVGRTEYLIGIECSYLEWRR